MGILLTRAIGHIKDRYGLNPECMWEIKAGTDLHRRVMSALDSLERGIVTKDVITLLQDAVKEQEELLKESGQGRSVHEQIKGRLEQIIGELKEAYPVA